jgi:hypothetical protein
METAQTLDEHTAEAAAIGEAISGLAAYSRFKGVQFVLGVQAADRTKYDHWGADNAEQIAAWITATSAALRGLGEKLEAGQLEQLEGLGTQRHIAVVCGDEENLGVGFTRSAPLPVIRETLKQIEAKWAS